MSNKDIITEEIDKKGKHKVINKPNGIKIKILKEPSEWYIEKNRLKAIEENKNSIISKLKQLKNQIITLQTEIRSAKELDDLISDKKIDFKNIILEKQTKLNEAINKIKELEKELKT